jgi:hypothetical protein
MRIRVWLFVPVLGVGICAAAGLWPSGAGAEGISAAEGEWGSVTGQFLVEGEIPKRKVLVERGDAQVKDAAICAADDILSDAVVVDPKTEGIANIFVYLPKAAKVHPKLKESEKKEVVFDQQGCRFVPHALLVRTDQVVVVRSNDNCTHNTNMLPLRNQAVNFALAPGDRKGREVKCKLAEKQPIKVECNIHSWMRALWLILDHPYAAISDEEGKFTIADLPAGEHELAIWHEGQGYIQRKYKVQVVAGKITDIGVVKVAAEKLAEK